MLYHYRSNLIDKLLHNARIACMTQDRPYGLVENGALFVRNGMIEWMGPESDLPAQYRSAESEALDCEGRLLTPGLIDCHSHVVYAGDRVNEFELRLNGASYEEISRQGGGIASTVKHTREACEQTLLDQSLPRLKRLMQEGVTTIEIKSGYGLDAENEMKMLRVAQALGETQAVRVRKTFLGAHALPMEFANKSDDYIKEVCEHMLPAAVEVGLVDAVDGFCEGIGFSPDQIERVFIAAKNLGLPVKLHAEQLSNLGGAVLAAKYNALSVDHLEYLEAADIPTLREHGTVAVLLPGAFYFLRESKLPPIPELQNAGVPIALATDSNPGSSPVTSLLLMLNMGCTLFSLTPEVALAGVTREAARALGLHNEIGTLEVGKRADLVLWDLKNPAGLAGNIGHNPCSKVMFDGEWRDV